MRTTIFCKDASDMNLKKAMFKIFNKHNGGKLIDTIYFQYTGSLDQDSLYSYTEIKNITDTFYVKNTKGQPSKYKTISGLLKRLNKDLKKNN